MANDREEEPKRKRRGSRPDLSPEKKNTHVLDVNSFPMLLTKLHTLNIAFEDDISFLRGAANLLGMAIERGRREAALRAEVRQREMVVREADHRIKNSLQLVASLLTLQRSRVRFPQAAAACVKSHGAISKPLINLGAHIAPFFLEVALGDQIRDQGLHFRGHGFHLFREIAIGDQAGDGDGNADDRGAERLGNAPSLHNVVPAASPDFS